MEFKKTKVAVIREPGHPVGKPAPCYLNCSCGAKPRTSFKSADTVVCSCGTKYSGSGWIL